MVCPRCGQSMAGDRCTSCGLEAGQTFVATGVVNVDTTGLPPGATFGASIGSTSAGTIAVDPDGARAKSAAFSTAAGPLAVGQSFGPRYHIIKLLGAGGMGAVYQAWDAELSVAVALKVIRPDTRQGTSPDAERRFKNELLLARQVTHKNVVRIHDLGEIDGIKYITMPYIKGEDLATTLRREGALPIPRALQIARQIAAGLEAAHDAGVVHRDLKPANVMLSASEDGDHAEIMDFGISVSSAEAASGAIVGTLEYMAPEQSSGAAVDARADIYAFGLIVYELLTGLRQVAGVSAQARFEAMKYRCREGLPALRLVDPAIPQALESLVMRCLATDPAERFQTTHDVSAALAELDDDGNPVPKARHLTRRLTAAMAVLVVTLLGGTYYVAQYLARPPVLPDPVTVVVADLENRTKDAGFDRTLEPMIRRALEGAGFISAYDRNGVIRTLGVRPPERFDEQWASDIAVKQGLGVVVSGSIEAEASGYLISLKAVQPVTGNVIATAQGRAGSRDAVVETATRLVATIRSALGDEASESAQMFAMASLSATSLDVVRHYAAAQEAASNNRFEEARQSALQAVALDPTFGVGYQVLAVFSRNLGRLQDADRYIKEALRHLDGMTERERLTTRGYYYRVTGDYQQCVKEYGELIARYAADVVGHNQLALCLTQLRNLRRAVDEMQQVVKLLPNRAIFRVNLSWYSSYAGDFAEAERQALAVPEPDVYSTHALAFAQLGREDIPAAASTYTKLGTMGPVGASLAASGLGDLALVEGRFADAARILSAGAERESTSGNPDAAAEKLVALASAELSRGRRLPAVAAAERALASSSAVKIRFLAARTFVEAGEFAKARPIVAGLAAELPAEPRAYAKLIEGLIAVRNGDPRGGISLMSEANGLLDTWIGHFELGRAYLVAEAYIQADSEFDRCIRRRGEALSLFLDEEPTFSYLPEAYYYQGRVREQLNTAGYADSFRAYLKFRGRSSEDPLAADSRRRLGL